MKIKAPNKITTESWATGERVNGKLVKFKDQKTHEQVITCPDKIQGILERCGRHVYLDQIAEKYKDTNLLSAKKAHHSKVIPAVEWGKDKGKRLLITEFGSMIDHSQPAFYQVDLETNTWEEKIPSKKNDYFVICFGSCQLFCYSISMMAFIEIPDPNKTCVADHINDYNNKEVLYEVDNLYQSLKQYAKRNGLVWEPMMPQRISWAPNNLQPTTRGQNHSKGANSESKENQQKFVDCILNWREEAKQSAHTFSYDELNRMKDLPEIEHPLFVKQKEDNALWECEQISEAQYEDNQIWEWYIEKCLTLGDRKYVESELINNETFGRWTEIIGESTGTLGTKDFKWEDIPVLDFIEKYVACSHMNSWDDAMWDDVIEWVRWVTNHGYINSEKRNPKLKIVGHKILGPYGEWTERDERDDKARSSWKWANEPYLFDQLSYFARGLHYNEDMKQNILSKIAKRDFKY